MYAWSNDHTAVICEVLKGMTIPLMYQCLLQITVFLSDPLGDDIIDFPIVEYQLEMAEQCFSQLGARRLFERRRQAGVVLPHAHTVASLHQGKASKETQAAPAPLPCTEPLVPEEPARVNNKLEALCVDIDSLVGIVNT